MSLSSFCRRIRSDLMSELHRSSNTSTSKPTVPLSLTGLSVPPASSSATPSSEAPPPTASTPIAIAESFTNQEQPMNFVAVVKALSLIPSILPVVGAFVSQADSLLASAPGASKFASVLAAVEAYIVKLETDVNVIAELKLLVTPLIEAAVAFAHAPSTTQATAIAPAAHENAVAAQPAA